MASGIHAIVLAAGRSSRFGRAKLLEELDGKPLVLRSLELARGVCPGNTCLVTGHSADSIADASARFADHIVHNPHYADGVGTSIACGVRACSQQADAIIVMLADQPLITASHLSDLVHSWSGDADAVVATGFSDVVGPPVLFGSKLFDELESLRGDQGARQVLHSHPDALTTVMFEPAAIDVDTPQDLEDLITAG